ncbi:MAG: MFS transporter, partial [Chloroflexi bacterium]|nr:MFS transporter [Chloroflexota bacterium]
MGGEEFLEAERLNSQENVDRSSEPAHGTRADAVPLIAGQGDRSQHRDSSMANAEGAVPPNQAKPKMGMLYALRFRNYRLLWIGTLFASAGQWIQSTTLGWVVYDLTGSKTLLGAIGAVTVIPMLLLAPWAGVAADRMDRRRLMLSSQVGVFLVALGLGVGLALHQVHVWHLFVFMLLMSVAQVFNNPVRQTVVFDLVPRDAIPNAVALNSAGFNSTRALGPTAAGFLIAWFGPAGNFFIQSAAYFGVVISVLMIAFPQGRRIGRETSVVKNLGEGFRYVVKDPIALPLIILGLVPPLLLLPGLMTLMPVFAKDVFHSGPTALGLLLSALGVGGLVGALFTASLGQFERRGLLQLGALLGTSMAGVGFSFAPSMAIAFPLLVVSGFFGMVYQTTNQTVLQLSIPDQMRGRVISILMLNMGLVPLGGMIAGAGAEVIGAPYMVTILSSAAS